MKPFILSGNLDLRLKVKLQLKVIIPPSPCASVAWGKSYLWILLTGHQRGFREIIFLCYWPRQLAQAWACCPGQTYW